MCVCVTAHDLEKVRLSFFTYFMITHVLKNIVYRQYTRVGGGRDRIYDNKYIIISKSFNSGPI